MFFNFVNLNILIQVFIPFYNEMIFPIISILNFLPFLSRDFNFLHYTKHFHIFIGFIFNLCFSIEHNLSIPIFRVKIENLWVIWFVGYHMLPHNIRYLTRKPIESTGVEIKIYNILLIIEVIVLIGQILAYFLYFKGFQ